MGGKVELTNGVGEAMGAAEWKEGREAAVGVGIGAIRAGAGSVAKLAGKRRQPGFSTFALG